MDAIEVEGSEAIEVIAQFDGAIVDVTHIVRDDAADAAARRARRLVGAGCARSPSPPWRSSAPTAASRSDAP